MHKATGRERKSFCRFHEVEKTKAASMRSLFDQVIPIDTAVFACILTDRGDALQATSRQHGVSGELFFCRQHKNARALALESLFLAILTQQAKVQSAKN